MRSRPYLQVLSLLLPLLSSSACLTQRQDSLLASPEAAAPCEPSVAPVAPEEGAPSSMPSRGPFLQLTAVHPSAAADLNAPAPFVATLTDGQGEPLAGQTVALAALRSCDQVVPTSAVTDHQGRIDVTLSGTTLGTAGIRATQASTVVEATVTFVSGPPDLSQTTLQAQQPNARVDATDGLAWAAQVRDAEGRPVPYAPVAFQSDVSGDVLSPRIAWTDASGACTSLLRGTEAGSRTITATLQSGSVTAPGVLVAGAPSPQNSLLAVSPNDLLADGSDAATLTVTLRDAFGNSVAHRPVVWAGDGILNGWAPGSPTTDSNGWASATVTSTRAQDENVVATCDGVSLAVPLRFHPGALDANQSRILVNSDFQPADGHSAIPLAVQLRDAFGNGIPGAPVQLSHFGNPATLSATSGSTDAWGSWSATVVSPHAGTHLLQARSGSERIDGAAHFVGHGPSCADNLMFDTPPLDSTGLGASYGLAAIDLDADGRLDLLSANSLGNTVGVLVGRGNGRFEPPVSYPTGQGPTDVAAADVDGDGRPDVVVTNHGDNTVSVLLQQGGGLLAAAAPFSTGAASSPNSMILADVDENGFVDVITANDSGTLSILLNPGDGTLGPATVVPVATQLIRDVIAIDLNHDNHLDLITANFSQNTLSVLLGQGDGTFAAPATYNVGSGPASVVASDFDQDGNVDILAAYQGDSKLQLFLGAGDGTLIPASNIPVTDNPFDLVAVDLNGDGNVDVAVLSYYAMTVSRLFGQGDGTFLQKPDLKTPGNGSTLLAGDFSGQGHLDLLSVTYDNTVNVWQGVGDGNFTNAFESVTAFAVESNPLNVMAKDLNGDGRMDLVATNFSSGTISVLLAQQPGTFAPQVSYPVGNSPEGLDSADFDGDGCLDLVVANDADATLSVLMGRSDGTFAPSVAYATGNSPRMVKAADVNADGVPDLVNVNVGDNTLAVLIGDGSGGFAAPSTYALDAFPFRLAITDLNNDGLEDVVTSNQDGQTVSVLLGQGALGLASAVSYNVASRPTDIAAGDVNEDGYMDVVVGDFDVGDLRVLLGRGDGTLMPPATLNLGLYDTYSLQVADFDQDGHLDIIASGYSTMNLQLGRGDGTFVNGGTFFAGQGLAYYLVAADMDGDGRLDMVSPDQMYGQVEILWNTCSGP